MYSNRDYEINDELYNRTTSSVIRDLLDDGLVIVHYYGSTAYWIEDPQFYDAYEIDQIISEMSRLFPELTCSEGGKS